MVCTVLTSHLACRRLLPKGLTGLIRIVDIVGVDKSTCCGTHISTTIQAGMIKIFGVQKVGKGIMRVTFAAGERCRRVVEDMVLHQAKLSTLVKDKKLDKQYEKIKALADEKERNKKTIKGLWQKIIAYKAKVCGAPSLRSEAKNRC